MKETSVAWISRIHLLVVGRSGHGFTKQHEARYPDIQSKNERSQEKGQMAKAQTPPSEGKWREEEGRRRRKPRREMQLLKAGIQCDEAS